MNTCKRFSLALIAMMSTGAATAADVQLPSNLPHRKPGLWTVQITHGGKILSGPKMCLDERTDAALYKWGVTQNKECSRLDVKVRGNEVVVDGVCKAPAGRGTMTTHAVTRFEGDSASHGEEVVHYDPPQDGVSDDTVVVDSRWIGPCEAGQKPGDVIIAPGMHINVLDDDGPAALLKNLLRSGN